jgi:hypothetical protein
MRASSCDLFYNPQTQLLYGVEVLAIEMRSTSWERSQPKSKFGGFLGELVLHRLDRSFTVDRILLRPISE